MKEELPVDRKMGFFLCGLSLFFTFPAFCLLLWLGVPWYWIFVVGFLYAIGDNLFTRGWQKFGNK